MESLTTEQQVVVKYASIIGLEFTYEVLASIVPTQLTSKLATILEVYTTILPLY